MNSSSIILGAPQWVLPACVLGGLALAVLAWSYLRTPGARSVRLTAALLKAVGVTALAACLAEPLVSGTRPRPGANLFVVLADNSRSLSVRPAGASESRGQTARALLEEDSPWQTRLAQDFELRRYLFDARLRPVDDFAELSLDGDSSALAGSLKMIARRYHQRPLAGVLLMTDGNATDLSGVQLEADDLPPIYPVIVGGQEVDRDVTVDQVAVSQTNFEAAPVTVQAQIRATGYPGHSLVVELRDEKDHTVERKVEKYPADGRPLSVRFQVRPEESGVRFYRVKAWAEMDGEPADPQADVTDESAVEDDRSRPEATLANNAHQITVDRGGGPFRVLYVSGRPNWEFKFLRRSLEEDDEIELTGLIRIAKREPKFDFRGHQGETTNPLFRGFDNEQDETAEQYDQPVLMRVGKVEPEELRGGFPKAADQLFGYHALILDDVEAEYFTPDQMALLQKYVSRRGGGLLMLGGQESFVEGKYRRTPLEELLPVYLEGRTEGGAHEQYKIVLSREGWIQPWVRLRSTEAEEESRLQTMPAFGSVNRVQTIKPGASVLAFVEDERRNQQPALVAQRFGKGRTAALLIGDLWRWGMRRELDQPRDLEKSWRQTIRWLVADVPGRIDFSAQRDEEAPGMPIRLAVRARDAEFEALDNAKAAITVTTPAGVTLQLDAQPSAEEPGLYETTYVPREQGAYRAKVIVTGPDGSEVGTRQAGWVAQPAAEEFRDLGINRALLETIAKQTGGEVVDADDLDRLVASLPNRKVAVTEPWTYPLWHQPWVFLVAIGCLIAEWGLRRLKGLP